MPMKKHIAGANCGVAAADRSRNSEREEQPTSLQRSRDHRPDVLPLEKRVRRPEAGSSETDERAGTREREAEAFSRGAVSGEADPEGRGLGKLLSPERRRCAVV